MADATVVLEKLRDPSSEGATARLAAFLVDEALCKTVGDLVDVRFAAAALRDGVRAFASSDTVAARVVRALTEAEQMLAVEQRTIGARVSPALLAGAHDLVSIASTPPREIIVMLLDREPVKKLLRAQVTDTLIA